MTNPVKIKIMLKKKIHIEINRDCFIYLNCEQLITKLPEKWIYLQNS